LAYVEKENGQSAEVDQLIVKLLKSNKLTEDTVRLLHQEGLKKNQFYPFLEALLLGDFEAFSKLDKKCLKGAEVKSSELERKIKVQAIPRALSGSNTNVQIAGYQQISEILKIDKEEVEAYIIEAVQEGIIKAKID
jgi:hypothetical protein